MLLPVFSGHSTAMMRGGWRGGGEDPKGAVPLTDGRRVQCSPSPQEPTARDVIMINGPPAPINIQQYVLQYLYLFKKI